MPDLMNQIHNLGWELGKVSLSGGTYRATASNPHGEKIERTGLTDKTAVANVLLAIIRKHKVRSAAQHYGGMWAASWVDKLPQIAEAYSKAPVYDPKAASAWKELAQDSVARHKVLAEHLTIKVVPEGEPYASAKEMADDIHKNQNFLVSNAHCDHPVWSVDENVSFRVVHDVMGHAVSGGDFGWLGENLACAAHFPLLSETAQQALFVECIMQTGYAAYYRSFGPQKVFLPDEDMFLNTQKEMNPDGHSGVHPSQSFPPTSMPELAPSPTPEGIMEKGFAAPHMEGSPVSGTFAKLAITMRDPNHGWESGHAPQQGMNAYTDMSVEGPGGVTDPLDAQGVIDNAKKIDSGWSQWQKEDGTPDREKMRHAIVNAFRVVLLSPRKDLRWNAVHYQDISHIPGNELDPSKYWDALETSRQNWNVKHRGESQRFAHLPFKKLLPKLNGVIFAHYPHMTMEQIHTKTNELIYEWRVEEEHQVMQSDEGKSEDKQKTANEVENKVNKGVEKRIKHFIDESVPSLEIAAADQMGFDMDVPVVEKVKTQEEKYGAFMGTHLNAIAQVSEHSDAVLDAALEDVKDHDGDGHHFRSVVLQLGISGVGPKVCSFAWLLLQPMTSQLGTIDTHMMDVLGHNYEKEMSTRDYFKFERELAAGRDASGYGHVPLGTFQWGMWDYKRTGPGTHQDHSAMAVHNPKDHNMIDWQAKTDATQTAKADWIKNAPWWWRQTEEARTRTSEQFDAEIATPQNKIPFKVESMAKQAEAKDPTLPVPWMANGQDIRTGVPGQTYAQFLRSTGVPAHSYWDAQDHAMGRYHPKGGFVEVANGKIDQTIHDHLVEILGPYNQPAAVA